LEKKKKDMVFCEGEKIATKGGNIGTYEERKKKNLREKEPSVVKKSISDRERGASRVGKKGGPGGQAGSVLRGGERGNIRMSRGGGKGQWHGGGGVFGFRWLGPGREPAQPRKGESSLGGEKKTPGLSSTGGRKKKKKEF